MLTLGVLANLSLLGFFKYYGWFSEELNALLTSLEVGRELPLLEIVLPVGISFYTFQGISYIVDVYRGDLDRPRPLHRRHVLHLVLSASGRRPDRARRELPAAARAAARSRRACSSGSA